MANSNFPQINLQTSGQYVQVNNAFQAVVPPNAFGPRLAATSGLTLAYFGGDFWTGSAFSSVANGTLALSASATNYIEQNVVTGALSKNTSSFTAGARPLFTVATGANGVAVNGYTDYRRIAWQDGKARFYALTVSPGAAITTDQPALDLAQTWNAGGVSFNAIKLNITDSASAAGSLLMDLQVGAASKWKVTKAGNATLAGNLTVSGTGPHAIGGAIEVSQNVAGLLRCFIANPNAATFQQTDLRIGRGTNAQDVFIGVHFENLQNAFLDNRTGGDFRFMFSGADRARITAGGYFKASNSGTYHSATSPSHELYSDNDVGNAVAIFKHAAATAANQLGPVVVLAGDPNSTSTYFFQGIGNATERFTARGNGGLANYQSNNVDLCDLRAKADVTLSPDYTDMVERLQFKHFRYSDAAADDFTDNITAQDIEQIAPELVGEWSGGLKSVMTYRLQQRINSTIPRLIKRIKALEARL